MVGYGRHRWTADQPVLIVSVRTPSMAQVVAVALAVTPESRTHSTTVYGLQGAARGAYFKKKEKRK